MNNQNGFQNFDQKLPSYDEVQQSMLSDNSNFANINSHYPTSAPSAPIAPSAPPAPSTMFNSLSITNTNDYNNLINSYKNPNNLIRNNYGSPSSAQDGFNEERFREILNRHEISPFFSSKLRNLASFKIVYLLDDSGSMSNVLDDSPLNKGLFKATRWDELREFMRISIDVATVFNPDGCDVYFLNRPMARLVKHSNDLDPYFFNKPSGYKPLRKALEKILNDYRNLCETKILVIIVTDGELTDYLERDDKHDFGYFLQCRPRNVYATILACTDDEDTMEYLNNWDKLIPRLDVVDDYRNEREEILNAQGYDFRFTYGDYVAKSFIGSIDPTIDYLDEVESEDFADYYDENRCNIL